MFWTLRTFLKDHDEPITPGLINEYASGDGVLLLPWQRSIIYAMDRKYRKTLSEEIAKNEKARTDSEKRKASAAKMKR